MNEETPNIILGVLVTYERNGWPHPDILRFIADMPFTLGVAMPVKILNNFVPAAAARNLFCRANKSLKADWIAMIDNDMAPPANLFDSVKDAPEDAGVVVPAFYIWNGTEKKLTLCWGLDVPPSKDGNTYGRFGPGYHEISKCGTGAIFIRPWVFEKIAYPYFSYIYNEDCGMDGTEDIEFCRRVREKGIKIYGNANVKVGHYHSVDLNAIAERLFTVDKGNGKGLSSPQSASPTESKAKVCPTEALK